MNITQEEINKLKSTKSEQEWNSVCDEIKAARNGSYPPDWWPVVKMSGLGDGIMSNWDSPDSFGIKIATF